MSSVNVGEGEFLVLRLVLPEADDSKFIKAIVTDDTNSPLGGSPFTLVNIGGGEYRFKNESVLKFPVGVSEVSAKYEIYDNAGFTVPSVEYGQAQDVWRISAVSGTVSTIITSLFGKLFPVDVEVEVSDDTDILEIEIIE